MTGDRARGWGIAVLVVAAVLSLRLSRLPRPVAADAPEASFSAARAFRHVREIAREPHPVGSEANERVESYLKAELMKLAGAIDIQIGRRGKLEVTNLVARVPGTDSTRTVVLCAHYDSVPGGPGAADDAAAVAAILETLRALRTGPPLRNDLLVLLTDGEEAGMLGARQFVATHPAAREPLVVLNFEARGNAGPVLMFQTSRPNGRLVRAFAAASPRPAANSLMAEVYERMPNDTDLTVFLRAGAPGMNFATIEGFASYHTPLDTPENLDRGSLQHHGEQMLAMARRLGDADLAGPDGGEVVYFDVLTRWLVVYPAWLVWPLTAAAALLLLLVVRAARIRVGKLLLGAGAGLGATVVVTALALGLGEGLRSAFGARSVHAPWLYLGIALATAGAALGLLRLAARWTGPDGVRAGALLLWLLLLGATSVLVPGATFLPLVPLVFGTLAIPVARRWGTLAGALASAPAALILVPIVASFYSAMTLHGAWIPAPLIALGAGALVPLAPRR